MMSSRQTDRQMATTMSTDRKQPTNIKKYRFGIGYITEEEFDSVFCSFQNNEMQGNFADVYKQVLETVDIAH